MPSDRQLTAVAEAQSIQMLEWLGRVWAGEIPRGRFQPEHLVPMLLGHDSPDDDAGPLPTDTTFARVVSSIEAPANWRNILVVETTSGVPKSISAARIVDATFRMQRRGHFSLGATAQEALAPPAAALSVRPPRSIQVEHVFGEEALFVGIANLSDEEIDSLHLALRWWAIGFDGRHFAGNVPFVRDDLEGWLSSRVRDVPRARYVCVVEDDETAEVSP